MTFRTSTKRSTLLAAALLTGAALTLSACASGEEAPEETTAAEEGFGDITLQLSWILNEEFAGEYFAIENGYFEDAGFSSVELVPGPSTGAAELLSGDVDIALSDSVAIGSVIANEGAPLKIVGATFQKNPFTILSLTENGDIATPADLVGKRIGVQDSNTSLFMALLAANDIDPSELEIVPVQYDPAPLINGEVDGFVAYITNEAITVDLMGIETTNLPFADNGLPFVAETFVTTQELIDTNPELIKAFLKAEIQGWTANIQDPEEGARLAVEVYGIDLGLDPEKALIANRAQIDTLVLSPDTEELGLFVITEELQQLTIDSLAGAGIVVSIGDLFDLSLLAEVYAENPELIDYLG